jgi:hypothetical protein
MIHVVVMKRLIGLPLLIHIELLLRSRSRSRSFKSRGVGVLKIEESESERLCTACTALVVRLAWSNDPTSYAGGIADTGIGVLVPDRSRGITQTKRDTLVLQVGGWAVD